MVDLDLLRVSLTKNGYFKVAELLKVHSRWDVLEHLRDHPGIDLVRSQIANILDQNPVTGEIPAFWDEVREYGYKAIDAFTLVALLFSHGRLIQMLRDASQGHPEFRGVFGRADLPNEKEYTNLAYAMACFGTADYRRGAAAISYDLTSAVLHLYPAGHLVRDLLRSKLRRAGWVDPSLNPRSLDRGLMGELKEQQFNRVLSMEWERFEAWLSGQVIDLPPFVGRFGLYEIGLFANARSPEPQAPPADT